MVTPTFAAGLGVVVAAGLAANMSKTVLHFSSPFPGRQCPVGGCGMPRPHPGTLASARPGVPIAPGPTPGTGADDRGPGAMGGVAQLPRLGGHQVTISYQLTRQWSGGFADQIIITGMAGPQYRTWTLAFGYPGARITSVQGARWQPGSTDWGVAKNTAGPDTAWPGEPGGPGGRDGVRLTVIVAAAHAAGGLRVRRAALLVQRARAALRQGPRRAPQGAGLNRPAAGVSGRPCPP